MLIDAQTRVSNAQAVTASAGSTDYIDLGAARSIGDLDLNFAITCDETTASAGASTVTFELQSDDNTSFSSPKTLIATGAIAKADLTAGRAPIFLKVPAGMTPERYVRVYYTVGTANLTAGKFTAAVVAGAQNNRAYPDAL